MRVQACLCSAIFLDAEKSLKYAIRPCVSSVSNGQGPDAPGACNLTRKKENP